MSRKNGNGPRLDLKLNLSPPPRRNPYPSNESPNQSPTVASPESSCVSSEAFNNHENSSETTSMMLVGCPNCLLYVMLSEEDLRCPQCKSSVLLNVSQENRNTTKRTTKRN